MQHGAGEADRSVGGVRLQVRHLHQPAVAADRRRYRAGRAVWAAGDAAAQLHLVLYTAAAGGSLRRIPQTPGAADHGGEQPLQHRVRAVQLDDVGDAELGCGNGERSAPRAEIVVQLQPEGAVSLLAFRLQLLVPEGYVQGVRRNRKSGGRQIIQAHAQIGFAQVTGQVTVDLHPGVEPAADRQAHRIGHRQPCLQGAASGKPQPFTGSRAEE